MLDNTSSKMVLSSIHLDFQPVAPGSIFKYSSGSPLRIRSAYASGSFFGGSNGFVLFSEKNKKSEPFSYRKKFGFCCCGAPPGTRTPGQLIKRNRCATIVNFQNHAEPLFLSSYREFAFYICCILCTCHPLLHPLSSRSGVQKVCKNVQSQNQPLKTGIGFL